MVWRSVPPGFNYSGTKVACRNMRVFYHESVAEIYVIVYIAPKSFFKATYRIEARHFCSFPSSILQFSFLQGQF